MTWRWVYRIPKMFGTGGALLLLAGGWIIFYVTTAIWSKEALSTFVATLNNNMAVQGITLLFLINVIAYIIRTATKTAVARKWLLIFWLPFPMGLTIFLAGFYINSVGLQDGKIIVGEGEPIQPPWETQGVVLDRIEPGLKDEVLGGEQSESAIFQYEPLAVLSDPLGAQHEVRGFPPTRIGSTYYHILDFGFAPGIRLSHEGQVIIESYVIQMLLPPGKADSFVLGELPYRLEIRIASSRKLEKGATKASVYNLKDLSFNVMVYRGEDLVYDGPSSDGIFFDGMKIEFTPHTFWVRIEAARRPGMIPLVFGLSLIVIGFPFWLGLKVLYLVQRGRLEAE